MFTPADSARLRRARGARLRDECRRTAVLAGPLVAGQVLTITMNVIDTLLAGHLGAHVLAATSTGYNVWILALLVVLGILLAVAPAVAQRDGAGRRAEVGAVFRQALWLGLALGLTFFVLLRCAAPLLALLGVTPDIQPGALAFLDAISWGAPALAIFFVCRNTSEGLSLVKPTMIISLLAVLVLLPLAWALMYGELGLPALGARGAGYAHATVLWLQAIAYFTWLARSPRYREARLFERFDAPDFRAIGRLLAVGVPMGFSVIMEGTLFVVTGLLVASFGEQSVSAHAIALNVASFTFMIPLGIAMATTVRVGNAVGARDASGIAWAGTAGAVIVCATQLVSACALFFCASWIAHAYTAEPEVAALATVLLGFAAVFQLSDGLQALFNGALRGLEDTLVPAFVTALSYWGVGFTLAWYFGRHLEQGPAGFWKGLVAGLTTSAVLLGVRFALRARRFLREGVPARADGAPPIVTGH